jgi:tape measure domain-containing protein
MRLEDLVIGLELDDSKFNEQIKESVNKARSDLKKNLKTDIGDSGLNLTPKVNDSALTALNKHLDKKEKHFNKVQNKFNNSPLTVKTNTRELDRLENQLKRVNKLSGKTYKVNIEEKVTRKYSQNDRTKRETRQSQSKQSQANKTKKQTSEIKNALSDFADEIVSGFEDAQPGFMSGLLGSIVSGVGQGISTSAVSPIADQLTTGFVKALSESSGDKFGSLELIGERLTQAFIKGVEKNSSKIPTQIQTQLEKKNKQLQRQLQESLGTESIARESKSAKARREKTEKEKKDLAREGTRTERRDAIRRKLELQESIDNKQNAIENNREKQEQGQNIKSRLESQPETAERNKYINEITKGLEELTAAEQKLIEVQGKKESELEEAKKWADKAEETMKLLQPEELFEKYREAILQVNGKLPSEEDIPKLTVADSQLKDMGAKAGYNASSNTLRVTRELFDAIESGNASLEQMKTLFHEIQHASDYNFGSSLEGIQNQVRGELSRKPTQFSAQEQNELASFVSKYSPNRRLVETEAEGNARRNLQEYQEKQKRKQKTSDIYEVAGYGGTELNELFQQERLGSIKEDISFLEENASEVGVDLSEQLNRYKKIIDNFEKNIQNISDKFGEVATGDASDAALDQLQKALIKQAKDVETFVESYKNISGNLYKEIERAQKAANQANNQTESPPKFDPNQEVDPNQAENRPEVNLEKPSREEPEPELVPSETRDKTREQNASPSSNKVDFQESTKKSVSDLKLQLDRTPVNSEEAIAKVNEISDQFKEAYQKFKEQIEAKNRQTANAYGEVIKETKNHAINHIDKIVAQLKSSGFDTNFANSLGGKLQGVKGQLGQKEKLVNQNINKLRRSSSSSNSDENIDAQLGDDVSILIDDVRKNVDKHLDTLVNRLARNFEVDTRSLETKQEKLLAAIKSPKGREATKDAVVNTAGAAGMFAGGQHGIVAGMGAELTAGSATRTALQGIDKAIEARGELLEDELYKTANSLEKLRLIIEKTGQKFSSSQDELGRGLAGDYMGFGIGNAAAKGSELGAEVVSQGSGVPMVGAATAKYAAPKLTNLRDRVNQALSADVSDDEQIDARLGIDSATEKLRKFKNRLDRVLETESLGEGEAFSDEEIKELNELLQKVEKSASEADKSMDKVDENSKRNFDETNEALSRQIDLFENGAEQGNIFDNVMSQLPGVLDDVATSALGLIGAASLGDVLARIGQQSVQAALEIERFKLALSFGNIDEPQQKLENLRETSDKLGTSFLEAKNAFKKLSIVTAGTTAGGNVDEYVQQLQEVFAARQATQQQQQRAVAALEQIFSKGAVQSEELRRQLSEAVPGAYSIAARAFGLSEGGLAKKLESRQIKSQEFVDKFLSQASLESTAILSKTIESGQADINRLRNNLEKLKIAMGETFMGVGMPILKQFNKALGAVADNGKTLQLAMLAVATVIGKKFLPALHRSLATVKAYRVALKSLGVQTLINTKRQHGLLAATRKLGLGLMSLTKTIAPVVAIGAAFQGLFEIMESGNESYRNTAKLIERNVEALRELRKEQAKQQEEQNNNNKQEPGILRKTGNFSKDWTLPGYAIKLREWMTGERSDVPNPLSSITEPLGKMRNRNAIERTTEGARTLLEKTSDPFTDPEALEKARKEYVRLTKEINDMKVKILSADDSEIPELRKEISKLKTERSDYIKETFGGLGQLQSTLERLKEERKEIKSDDSFDKPGEKEARLLEYDQLIAGLEKRITNYKNVVKETNQAYKEQQSLLDNIATSLTTVKFKASSQLKETQNELARQKLSGEITDHEYSMGKLRSQREELRTRQDEVDTQFSNTRSSLQETTEREFNNLSSLEELSGRGSNILELVRDLSPGEIDQILKKYEENQQKLPPRLRSILETAKEHLKLRNKSRDLESQIIQNQQKTKDKIEQRQKKTEKLSLKARDLARSFTDLQREGEQFREDFANKIEDFKRKTSKEIRGFQESYNDLMQSLSKKIKKTSTELEQTQREIERTETAIDLYGSLTAGKDSFAKQLADLFVDIQGRLAKYEDKKEKIELDRLSIEQQTVERSRKIRDLQEQRESMERQHLKQLDDLKQQRSDFIRRQNRQWEDILKNAKDLSKQVHDAGYTMDELGYKLAEEGNELVDVVYNLASRLNTVTGELSTGSTSGSSNDISFNTENLSSSNKEILGMLQVSLNEQQKQNALKIIEVFKEHGFTDPDFLAGALSNAYAESAMATNNVGDNGHAFGAWQANDVGGIAKNATRAQKERMRDNPADATEFLIDKERSNLRTIHNQYSGTARSASKRFTTMVERPLNKQQKAVQRANDYLRGGSAGSGSENFNQETQSKNETTSTSLTKPETIEATRDMGGFSTSAPSLPEMPSYPGVDFSKAENKSEQLTEQQKAKNSAEKTKNEKDRQRENQKIKDDIAKLNQKQQEAVEKSIDRVNKLGQETKSLINNQEGYLNMEQQINKARREATKPMRDQIEALQDQREQIKEQISDGKEGIKDLRNQVSNMEDGEAKANLQEQINNTESHINQLEAKLPGINNQISKLQDIIPAVEKRATEKTHNAIVRNRQNLEDEQTIKGLQARTNVTESPKKEAELNYKANVLEEEKRFRKRQQEIIKQAKEQGHSEDSQYTQNLLQQALQVHENKLTEISKNFKDALREIEANKIQALNRPKIGLLEKKAELAELEGDTPQGSALRREASLLKAETDYKQRMNEIEGMGNVSKKTKERLRELAKATYENTKAQIRQKKKESKEERRNKYRDYSQNVQADLLSAQANASTNPYKSAALEAEGAKIQEQMRFREALSKADEMAKKTGQSVREIREQLHKINEIKLNKIREQANLLGTEIRDGVKSAIDSSLRAFFKAEASLSETLNNFARSILKMFADLSAKFLAQSAASGLFSMFSPQQQGNPNQGSIFSNVLSTFGGGGGFIGDALTGVLTAKDGATVEEDDIPNYDKGGSIWGLGSSVAKAMKKEGTGAVPIVAHRGEEVLSDKNNDAELFRALQRSGKWGELKDRGVNNYELGGTVGKRSNSSNLDRNGSDTINRGKGSVTVNQRFDIKAKDPNSLRKSARQLQTESEARARRSYERYR